MTETFNKKILFLVTGDTYFLSHRLSLARALKAKGYEIVVATHVSDHQAEIEAEGFHLRPLQALSRSKMGVISEIKCLWELWRLYRAESPDIVHHIALKPALYGSLIAWIMGVPHVINTLGGMGYLFISTGFLTSIVRRGVMRGLGWLCRRPTVHLVVQNKGDYALWAEQGRIPSGHLHLVRGSGVDTAHFIPGPEPKKPIVIVCPARLLWDKGIGELTVAARILKEDGIDAKVHLYGPLDEENPSAIPSAQIEKWQAEGVISWKGEAADMAPVLQKAHIVALPSYREGLPKALLEAASCGKPIVTTEDPGCRELVTDHENGLIISIRSSKALADALKTLIENSELRRKFGKAGRTRVEKEFSDAIIVKEMMAIYENSQS